MTLLLISFVAQGPQLQLLKSYRKRLLDLSSSNDLINWKAKYGKTSGPFEILKIHKANDEKEPSSFDIKLRKKGNEVSIELNHYLNPNTTPLSNKIKNKLSRWQDWIDYWAIDFNTQGETFRNMWFSYRTPKKRELALISDPYSYKKPGNYQLSIKVIDIFDIETVQNYNIELI
jgi:hypothetical protein